MYVGPLSIHPIPLKILVLQKRAGMLGKRRDWDEDADGK